MSTAAHTTHTQRIQALAAANRIRTARANLLQEIRGLTAREGVAVAVDIIRKPPPDIAGLPLERLARSIHRFGHAKASTLLFVVTDGRAWMNPTVGELTGTQRQRAYDVLDRHCHDDKRKRGA